MLIDKTKVSYSSHATVKDRNRKNLNCLIAKLQLLLAWFFKVVLWCCWFGGRRGIRPV